MIDPTLDLAVSTQCQLLGLARSTYYYESTQSESDLNLALMEEIDRLYLAHPVYPYLLRGLNVDHPNHVWCSDLTYIPFKKGFLYLVAIMDWHSRKVLTWRVSNTMTSDFCVAALTEALALYGTPEIFNTDQGAQFTSDAFTSVLRDAGVRVSMDGVGRAIDNVFIERLWRTLKYDHVYLNPADSGNACRDGITEFLTYYNEDRPHSALNDATPDEVYYQSRINQRAA
jgi:putative transposase